MSSVLKLLNEGLEEDPSNWDLRIELAQKLVENGDADSAANTVASGEGHPADDAQLHQALE
ncbi:MAG: tetratricopeptide repeat protein, partial [Verrucomicrobiales bacterium]|nr:tetratricopeptide repeat protein [Verrucomicrobiales bacterium]